MLKIMLKEPVGGGVYGQPGVGARTIQYMYARGSIDTELEGFFDRALVANERLQ